MNKKMVWITGGTALISLLAGWFVHGMFGGKGSMPPMGRPAMPPAAVTVQVLKEQSLQPGDEYIAKVDPVEDVMIRSEVPGYIAAVHFTEGGLVKEGDLLFTIDRSSYQAAADAAEAELVRAQKLYDRMKNADTRSISKADMDSAESAWLRAKAALQLAQVSLNYTEIKAPVNGRIGAAYVTKGNYVTSASGALARIVQIDPVRVVFSLTDRDYLALRQKEIAGTGSARIAKVRLPGGSVLATLGKKDFDDNAINPATGTIAVRYLFDNADGLLVPGGYVKILLENQDAEKGIRIPQKAVLVDQQGSYVLTVDEAGKVSPARIQPGVQLGAELIVPSGLKAGDRVVIDGVQKAVPGATVKVTLAEDGK